jgi:transposase InsO family protein
LRSASRRAAGIAPSIGNKGDCFGNAVAESFFATLEEGADPRPLPARQGWAAHRVFEYIEVFFNRRRRQSALGMLSPRRV